MKMAKLKLTGLLLVFAFVGSAASGWTQELNGADDALLSFRRSLDGMAKPGTSVPDSSTTLALNLGQSNSMGLTYAYKPADANTVMDMLTYGLNLNTKLGANSSMTNMMYISSPQDSGRVTLNLDGKKAPAENPKSDNMFVHNSDLKSGKLNVKLNYQDVGKDFSGFTALKQQKAAPGALLNQLEKEKGLKRLGFQADYGIGMDASTGLGYQQISDDGGDINIQSFKINSGSMKLSAEVREIDEGFASLSLLPGDERQKFGKETGMKRMSLAGDFALSSSLQLATSFARVTAADAGVVKYGVSLKGSKFNVAANFQDIAPEFTRINDLADPDKQRMAAEQGMKRYDLTTHFQASKYITIDSFMYDAKHSTLDIFKRQLTNSITINPAHGPKLTMMRDEVDSGSSDAVSEFLHQKFTLDHTIGATVLNMVQDTVNNESPTGMNQSVETRILHFGTNMSGGKSLIGDWNTKKTEQSDGRFEDIQTLMLKANLVPKLTFTGLRTTVQTDQSDTLLQEYSVAGKVLNGLSLAAKFGTAETAGIAVGEVQELSLSPAGAKDYWMFKQTSWSFRFAQVQNADKVATETKGGKVESQILDHKVAVAYLGTLTPDGQQTIIRSFSIAGDQDPNRRLHYDLAYKARDVIGQPMMLIRRYNADWQINPTTKLTYNYFNFNEKADGSLEPVGGERIKLTTPLTKRLGLIGQWENADNYQQAIFRNTLSLGLTGKVSALGNLEASYGFDRVVTASGTASSRTYKLKYDYKVSEVKFITFSGRYTDWNGQHPVDPNADDIQFQLDFKTIFN